VVPIQRQPSILIVQFREAAGLFYGSALLLSIEVMAAHKARKRSAVNVKNKCDGAMGDVLAQQFLKEPLLKWWCHHTRLVTDMASIRSPSSGEVWDVGRLIGVQIWSAVSVPRTALPRSIRPLGGCYFTRSAAGRQC